MQTIRDIAILRKAVAALRADGGKIAFVPTMGALHAGHMALVREARARAAHVVASVFVNPTQFGPNEDFSRYPRQEAADAALLEEHGCALLWLPPVEVMYPEGHATRIGVSGVSDGLCGASRPGHFDGVATVVAKLFNQVQPDIALFGEKDYQQLAVIRRMALDLDFSVEVAGVPTQRDADGLALSSRNAYLSPEERIAARALPRALGEAAQAIQAGGDIGVALEAAHAALMAAGFDPIDYVELRDAETLAPVSRLDRPARILAAARLGKTRLIDNLPVLPAA
ncbi:MAG TPA: pantoate--beta-alanine ligase [Allosphingosinicella sp.]